MSNTETEKELQQLREQLAARHYSVAYKELETKLAAAQQHQRVFAQQIEYEKSQYAAEAVKPYVELLIEAQSELTCHRNETHYCPNCDRSLFNIKVKIDALLAKK